MDSEAKREQYRMRANSLSNSCVGSSDDSTDMDYPQWDMGSLVKESVEFIEKAARKIKNKKGTRIRLMGWIKKIKGKRKVENLFDSLLPKLKSTEDEVRLWLEALVERKETTIQQGETMFTHIGESIHMYESRMDFYDDLSNDCRQINADVDKELTSLFGAISFNAELLVTSNTQSKLPNSSRKHVSSSKLSSMHHHHHHHHSKRHSFPMDSDTEEHDSGADSKVPNRQLPSTHLQTASESRQALSKPVETKPAVEAETKAQPCPKLQPERSFASSMDIAPASSCFDFEADICPPQSQPQSPLPLFRLDLEALGLRSTGTGSCTAATIAAATAAGTTSVIGGASPTFAGEGLIGACLEDRRPALWHHTRSPTGMEAVSGALFCPNPSSPVITPRRLSNSHMDFADLALPPLSLPKSASSPISSRKLFTPPRSDLSPRDTDAAKLTPNGSIRDPIRSSPPSQCRQDCAELLGASVGELLKEDMSSSIPILTLIPIVDASNATTVTIVCSNQPEETETMAGVEISVSVSVLPEVVPEFVSSLLIVDLNPDQSVVIVKEHSKKEKGDKRDKEKTWDGSDAKRQSLQSQSVSLQSVMGASSSVKRPTSGTFSSPPPASSLDQSASSKTGASQSFLSMIGGLYVTPTTPLSGSVSLAVPSHLFFPSLASPTSYTSSSGSGSCPLVNCPPVPPKCIRAVSASVATVSEMMTELLRHPSLNVDDIEAIRSLDDCVHEDTDHKELCTRVRSWCKVKSAIPEVLQSIQEARDMDAVRLKSSKKLYKELKQVCSNEEEPPISLSTWPPAPSHAPTSSATATTTSKPNTIFGLISLLRQGSDDSIRSIGSHASSDIPQSLSSSIHNWQSGSSQNENNHHHTTPEKTRGAGAEALAVLSMPLRRVISLSSRCSDEPCSRSPLKGEGVGFGASAHNDSDSDLRLLKGSKWLNLGACKSSSLSGSFVSRNSSLESGTESGAGTSTSGSVGESDSTTLAKECAEDIRVLAAEEKKAKEQLHLLTSLVTTTTDLANRLAQAKKEEEM